MMATCLVMENALTLEGLSDRRLANFRHLEGREKCVEIPAERKLEMEV